MLIIGDLMNDRVIKQSVAFDGKNPIGGDAFLRLDLKRMSALGKIEVDRLPQHGRFCLP